MTRQIKPKNTHVSVLKDAVLTALNVQPGGYYLDATAGRGGHMDAILTKLGPNGKLFGIDQDMDAIEYCREHFQGDKRVTLFHTNFVNVDTYFHERFDGILMDLGLSSPQIDNAERGFSYQHDGNLDMRMDQQQELDAGVVLNSFSYEQLCKIFQQYGEIHRPQRVVRAIIANRPLKTTSELVNIIRSALSFAELQKKNGHPEKVYFQALRIYVNQELDVLKQALPKMASLLKVGGVLCVITFHSLEEKITKKIFRDLTANKLPPEIPINEAWQLYAMDKILLPTVEEINVNSRAASAKLFVLHRLKEKINV